METINEIENVFRTPNANNLKHKRAAFSSVKNKAKKALTDVKNTLDKRYAGLEEKSVAGKTRLNVDEMREVFKSPKRLVTEKTELKNEVDDDFVFTSCRCSSDVSDFHDFWKLPEELVLTKEDIDLFATRWSNKEICHDIIASSPIKFDSDVFDSSRDFDDSILTTFKKSESFDELLNESFGIVPPELPF